MNAQDVLVASVIIIIIWWWSSWPPPPSSSFHYYFPKRCYTWPYIFFSSSWNYFLGSWDTILANCQVCFLLISSCSSSWAPLFLPHLIHATVSQDLILSPLSFSFWSDITQSNCSNYSYVNGISHSRCQIHLISPGSHMFLMSLFGCRLFVSIWSSQIIQKEIYHLPLRSPPPPSLLHHSGSHLRAPSFPQLPKLEMQRSFWISPTFILMPHIQAITNACQFYWPIFPRLVLPFSLIQTPAPLTWTFNVVSFLLNFPLQAHPPYCYPSNIFKTERWAYYSLDGLKSLWIPPPFYRLKTGHHIMMNS